MDVGFWNEQLVDERRLRSIYVVADAQHVLDFRDSAILMLGCKSFERFEKTIRLLKIHKSLSQKRKEAALVTCSGRLRPLVCEYDGTDYRSKSPEIITFRAASLIPIIILPKVALADKGRT